jgi:PIN domain nuclease of toxin-antitoxin system
MKCLLDTHTAFWYFEGSPDLSAKAKAVIEDSKNEVFVSIVSAWEIAIKRSLDKEKQAFAVSLNFSMKSRWSECS